ncbi:MAG: HNH endonuclease [Microbispora sp.]|nr:HNH endonuclease [Microbispora sp.]
MSSPRIAVPIPDGLAAIPPGAELAALLAEVNVERVSGFDTVEVLKAAYRQVCHARAWFLHALLEVGLRDSFSGDEVARLEVPDEFAPDEARAALVWSRRRANSTFELAWNVHRRLPILGEAMLAGILDEPRAVAFVRWTLGLTDEQAAMVCDQLVPQASSWTVGELIERIQRMALAIDPAWAERRYTEAVRRRRVVGTRNEDGTATVSGLDLPLDRAAAGCDRIDELARACKRAGDRRPIDHIRVDLFLGSLDGTFEGMSDDEIVTYVLTHPFHDAPHTPHDEATHTPRDGAGNTSGGDNGVGGSDGPDGPDGPDGGVGSGDDRGRPGGGGACSGDDGDARGASSGGGGGACSGGGGGADGCFDGGFDHPGGDARSTGASDAADDLADAVSRAVEDDGDAETCRRPGDGAGRAWPSSGPRPMGSPSAEARESATAEAASGGGEERRCLTDRRATGASVSGGGVEPHRLGSRRRDTEPVSGGGEERKYPHSRRAGAVPALNDWAKCGGDEPGGAGVRHAQAPTSACVGASAGARGWAVREIRTELTTLLGLDEHPACLPGWGVIHPRLARRIVAGMLGGEWRYAICYDNGHLALTGLTRARPTIPGRSRPARDRRRGGIVELQITLSDLRMLTARPAGALGAWAPVVADLAARAASLLITGRGVAACEGTVPDNAAARGPVKQNPDEAGTRDEITGRRDHGDAVDRGGSPGGRADAWGDGMVNGQAGGRMYGPGDGQAEGWEDGAADSERRRQAGAALRRYVQIRGRVCSWPGCRTPATRTDQDHILPWAERGLTEAENLHLACRHDHRARHHGGWRVSTAGPHLVIWTSPLGHRYPSPLPKIIIPACDPEPRSLPALGPHRDRDDLPEGPTMTLVPEPSPPREASQAGTGVATPPEPDGGRQRETRDFVRRELEEPPF